MISDVIAFLKQRRQALEIALQRTEPSSYDRIMYESKITELDFILSKLGGD